MIKIPKYVAALMERARYNDTHPDGLPGYTLDIYKATPYVKLGTLKDEAEKLCQWAGRNGAEARVIMLPDATHYTEQCATVLITDPVMASLEPMIEICSRKTRRRHLCHGGSGSAFECWI